MSTVLVPQYLRVALQTNKFLRNGSFYPDASVHSYLVDETNRISAYRVKTLASFSCPISAIPAMSATARTRWRAYVHTSPFAKYIYARFVIAQSPQLNGAGGFIGHASADPYAQLLVEQTNGTDVGTAVRHYGAIYTDTANDTPGGFDLSKRKLDATVSGDTDYLLTVSDEQGARIVACDVYEACADLDTSNGYLSSAAIVGDGPIFDAHVGSVASALRTHWKRGASSLFTWASNTDATAPVNATATYKNVIDTSITTVSAATHGWTLDLTNRSTVRRASSGVPAIMYAYCKTAGASGNVVLKDSGGTILATCNTTSGTAAWISSGAFYLPATAAKYDVHLNMASGVGNTTAYAVSLLQYEA